MIPMLVIIEWGLLEPKFKYLPVYKLHVQVHNAVFPIMFAVLILIWNNFLLYESKKIQKIAKKRKEEQKLDPELEKLFNQLQIIRENERLTLIANKLNKENQVMKDLIILLIKENQKIKTENKLLIKNIN